MQRHFQKFLYGYPVKIFYEYWILKYFHVNIFPLKKKLIKKKSEMQEYTYKDIFSLKIFKDIQ